MAALGCQISAEPGLGQREVALDFPGFLIDHDARLFGVNLLPRDEEILPVGEENVVIIHVQGVDRDGQVVSTIDFRVVTPPSPPKRPR